MKTPAFDDIRRILEMSKAEAQRRYGVTEMGVFGSYVRGEETATSDVDILVEFNHPVGFFRFLEVEEYLGNLLGAKVDLAPKPALKPFIGRQVMKEVIPI